MFLFALVVALLGFGSVSPVTKEDYGEKLLALVETLHTNCVARSKAKESSIEMLKAGNFVEDITLKKYVTCLLMDTTVIDEKGDLNLPMLMELCPPKIKEKAPKIAQNCFNKYKGDGSDLDSRNYKIIKCVYDTDKESFVMF